MTERGKRLVFIGLCALLPLVALTIVEGLSSFAVAARALREVQLAEASHTERDTLLGWINRPNVRLADHYGPGLHLETNAQRVRHKGPLAPRAGAGHRRVICVGDSFTLGYGVSDDDTWCSRLARLDSAIESVNMGQGGYGLDQAYLWYMRDGAAFHADVHLFAFIADDFRRMQTTDMYGVPKPHLVLDGGRVRAEGVPVAAPGMRPALNRWATAARNLRSYVIVERFTRREGGQSGGDSVTWEVARAAMREMARRDSANGTKFVAVYLPTAKDHRKSGGDRWRKRLADAAARGEFAFVDLTEPFREVRGDSVDAMFIQPGQMAFTAAAGHYTAEGNAWVATNLLRLVPALSRAP